MDIGKTKIALSTRYRERTNEDVHAILVTRRNFDDVAKAFDAEIKTPLDQNTERTPARMTVRLPHGKGAEETYRVYVGSVIVITSDSHAFVQDFDTFDSTYELRAPVFGYSPDEGHNAGVQHIVSLLVSAGVKPAKIIGVWAVQHPSFNVAEAGFVVAALVGRDRFIVTTVNPRGEEEISPDVQARVFRGVLGSGYDARETTSQGTVFVRR